MLGGAGQAVVIRKLGMEYGMGFHNSIQLTSRLHRLLMLLRQFDAIWPGEYSITSKDMRTCQQLTVLVPEDTRTRFHQLYLNT